MNIGLLNRKISIQSPPSAKDAGGELTGSWTTECSPWAKVTDKSSTESVSEGSEVMTTSKIFTIRYRTGITSAMRILYDSQYWQIVGIIETGKKDYLELHAILKTNW